MRRKKKDSHRKLHAVGVISPYGRLSGDPIPIADKLRASCCKVNTRRRAIQWRPAPPMALPRAIQR